MDEGYQKLLARIAAGRVSKEDIEREKIVVARTHGLDLASNAELIVLARAEGIDYSPLKTKPVRTLSGVANIAVMWLDKEVMVDGKPYSCPYQCVYCAQGARTNAAGVKLFAPKSYIGVEPTTLRAIRNDYDPYRQVENRLKQLRAIGHATDKCELIIMGGTFMAWQLQKREAFVKNCFDAFNGNVSATLEEAQLRNETARRRVIGLTIETRGDVCSERYIKEMLGYGTTRVEVGVQSTDERLLRMTKRGHGAAANIAAFSRLRAAGLKITAHWMPGLTGIDGSVDMEKEIALFAQLFDSPAYRPDELKIYPALVIPGTELYELWKSGNYAPLPSEQALDLLIELKKRVPEYVRIKRVSRDISEHEIASGAKTTNLRQLAQMKMLQRGMRCRCIRCREIGTKEIGTVALKKTVYDASGGKEFFISMEETGSDSIIGFVRLRIDESGIAKIRELHVYGEMAPIGAHGEAAQHRGFGRQLVAEAERIAREQGKEAMHVTAGVGAREYYRKHGYILEKPYMVRAL